MAWAFSGFAHLYIGDTEEAERRLLRCGATNNSRRWIPNAFHYDVAICAVALLKRDYEGAVALGRTVSELNLSFNSAARPYLAALGLAGSLAEATVVCRRILAIDPGFTIARFLAETPFERTQDRELFATGFRRAGVPEGLVEDGTDQGCSGYGRGAAYPRVSSTADRTARRTEPVRFCKAIPSTTDCATACARQR